MSFARSAQTRATKAADVSESQQKKKKWDFVVFAIDAQKFRNNVLLSGAVEIGANRH